MLREAYEEKLSCALSRYLILFCLTHSDDEPRDMWLDALKDAYETTAIISSEQFLHTLCGLANAQSITNENFNKIYNKLFTDHCE